MPPVLALSRVVTERSAIEFSKSPMPPAAETADTRGARAIQVIGDWKIG